MSSVVSLFLGTLESVVEIRLQSEDRPESTSVCLYLNGQLVPVPLHLSDAKCDELLDWLIDRRAARLRGPGGSR